MRIKKNDTIKIIAGKDRGKQGKVLKIFPQQDRILVEGANLYKKHVRPTRQGEKGQVVEVPRPLHVSNAMFVCPKCGKPSRLGSDLTGAKKARACRICRSVV